MSIVSIHISLMELLNFFIYGWTQLKSSLGEDIYIIYFITLAIVVGFISIFLISLEDNRDKLRRLKKSEKIILSLIVGGPAAYPIFILLLFAAALNILQQHFWALLIILVFVISFVSATILSRIITQKITLRELAEYTIIMILSTTALFLGLSDAIFVSMLFSLIIYSPLLTALKLKIILVLGVLFMAVPFVILLDSAWCILKNKKNDMSDKIMAWLKSSFTAAYYKIIEVLVRVTKRGIRKITRICSKNNE